MTSSSEGILTDSLLLAQQQLQSFAQRDDFKAVFNSTFSTGYDPALTEATQQAWLSGDFSLLPAIQILDADAMQGLRAGFSAQTGQIYVNADFLGSATADQIAAVLIEEIGHSLDSQLKGSDTAGDEGELFSTYVRDVILSEEQLATIKAEKDQFQIVVDGIIINLEASGGGNSSNAPGQNKNVAPEGKDNTIKADEDTAYTFVVNDFGFSDSKDNQPDKFKAVKITTLPTAGSLTLTKNGTSAAVTEGSFISVDDITAGNLKFTPASNAYGDKYASFTFQVQDDGSTAKNKTESDLDPSANTITFNVTPVNDAPTGTASATLASGTEDTLYTITPSQLLAGFTDVDGDPLSVSGLTASSGSLVNKNDGTYAFIPAANYNGIVELQYNVIDDKGGSVAASQSFSLAAVNDIATISGNASGAVIEDTTINSNDKLTATGSLTVNDVDTGENKFKTNVTGTAGNLGNLSITEAGAWSYNVDNSAVQFLGAGVQHIDTFTVKSFDGTASQPIQVTVTGVNDEPTLAASVTSSSYTDTANNDSFDLITGQLTSTDPDAGDTATYSVVGGSNIALDGVLYSQVTGSYGILSVNKTTGAYTFTPDDAIIEGLKSNASESFTLQVADGFGATDSKSLSIDIAGANDTAAITGIATGAVIEDSNGNLATSGSLSVSDRDTGENRFITGVTGAGNLGSLSITEAGDWSYNVDNSAVQFLGAGVQHIDTFTIKSFDGTASQQIEVTVTGVNDAPIAATLIEDQLISVNDPFSLDISGNFTDIERTLIRVTP